MQYMLEGYVNWLARGRWWLIITVLALAGIAAWVYSLTPLPALLLMLPLKVRAKKNARLDDVNEPVYLHHLKAFAQCFEQQPETMHINSPHQLYERLNKNLHARRMVGLSPADGNHHRFRAAGGFSDFTTVVDSGGWRGSCPVGAPPFGAIFLVLDSAQEYARVV